MEKFIENLMREAENNPTAAIAVGAAALAACAKLITAWGNSQGSRAYARKTNYDLRTKYRDK